MSERDWKALVVRYAKGRPICNCGNAFYTPCGVGIEMRNGVLIHRTDMLVCACGCSANQIRAREEIASEVVRELKGESE